MIEVKGRVLPQPKLSYRDNQRPPDMSQGSWNLNGVILITAKSLGRWSILKLNKGASSSSGIESRHYNPFVKTVRHTFGETSLISDPYFPWSAMIKDADDDNTLKDQFASCQDCRVAFLVVILPDDDARLYKRVKYLGDIEYGIHTVCVIDNPKKFSKAKPESGAAKAYCANVALKINLKLGGCNHALDNKHMGIIFEENTMVVGIDVTHPAPGSATNAPSIAAMVASVDNKVNLSLFTLPKAK